MGSVGRRYHRARAGERRGERTIVRHTSLMCGGHDGSGIVRENSGAKRSAKLEFRRHRGCPVQSDTWVQPGPSVTTGYSRVAPVDCTNAQLHVLASINPDATKNVIVVARTQRLGGPHRPSSRVPCERATHSRRRPIARVVGEYHIGCCRRQTPSLHAHLDREPYEWAWARGRQSVIGD
jgi:hypothetical protein